MSDDIQIEDTKAAVTYQPLYVIPASHPEQRKLPEDERDETIARAGGASPVEGTDHWRLPDGADSDAARRVQRRFSTKAAKRRMEAAVVEAKEAVERAGRADRLMLARAANAEVEAHGLTPARPLPENAGDPEAERYYYYTAREAESPYHYKLLDTKAQELGVKLLIDRDRNSPHWGLRYTIEKPHPELEAFRTEEAKRDRAESFRRYSEEKTATKSAAATLTSDKRINMVPLTLADPEKDPELYKRAHAAIGRIGTARLKKLVEITTEAREEIFTEERKLKADGKRLQFWQIKRIGTLSRAIARAREVLDERAKAGENYHGGAPVDARNDTGKARPGSYYDQQGRGGVKAAAGKSKPSERATTPAEKSAQSEQGDDAPATAPGDTSAFLAKNPKARGATKTRGNETR
ncbi:hypothetical protein CKO28_02560 [Rhodovibrio sodomensis]|uniref:Large polyvalent protein-associated domain-containing protein n=1 Tax=Rhodovibrio sodomensis TaxID=1088 RepID=A0ABS1D937_9PROT|nr:hypothetical protein [Rhodovibrio sodomensis]MBK1666924.1 hypothetical protein [Rhodovibrio sodomensis]